jgi:alpha-ribazole phosphatase
VLLVRHTAPDVAPGVCYGRLDLGLAAGSDASIAACLTALPPVCRVISSPARRCRVLAEAIAARDGADLRLDDRLWELAFGSWEGVAWDAISRSCLDAWAADPWGYAPGGGETLGLLWERVADFLAVEGTRSDGLAIVSHHGPLRVLAAQRRGWPWQRLWEMSFACGGHLEVA